MFPHSTSGQTNGSPQQQRKGEKCLPNLNHFRLKIPFTKIREQGCRGRQEGIWFVFKLTQEMVSQKRVCLAEEGREGRVRIVHTKESCGKRGENTRANWDVSGAGRHPVRTPPSPPSLPPLSRIHLSPNPFPYFTDNNKERALGA